MSELFLKEYRPLIEVGLEEHIESSTATCAIIGCSGNLHKKRREYYQDIDHYHQQGHVPYGSLKGIHRTPADGKASVEDREQDRSMYKQHSKHIRALTDPHIVIVPVAVDQSHIEHQTCQG